MPVQTTATPGPSHGWLEDTVVVLTPATKTDPYTGEQVPDWSQAPAEAVEAAEVQPLSSTEAVLTAGTVVSRWRCYLDASTSATTSKRIRWDGVDYEVDGRVEPWKVGGVVDHVECTLKLVEEPRG